MRKLAIILVSFVLLLSCDNAEKQNRKVLSKSSGNINNLSVILDNELWEGSVGNAIRNTLAAPVYGLPQEEPLFNISQIPTSVFSGFVTKSRIILKIEKDAAADVKIGTDVFARPQKVIVVTGKTNTEIINQLNENAEKIIAAFKNEEIKEKQRRIRISLNKNNTIKEKLGVSIEFPSAYRIAKDEENFYWIRRDISTGTTNIMLYELPYKAIKESDSLISQIIKMRDSIGKKYIPGPVDGSYMVTEPAYAPFLAKTIIDNKQAFETRGLWDVKNAFMSGPFLNLIINDKINDRLLVVEGFAYAPSVSKRKYMFELEAIIKSIKIDK